MPPQDTPIIDIPESAQPRTGAPLRRDGMVVAGPRSANVPLVPGLPDARPDYERFPRVQTNGDMVRRDFTSHRYLQVVDVPQGHEPGQLDLRLRRRHGGPTGAAVLHF